MHTYTACIRSALSSVHLTTTQVKMYSIPSLKKIFSLYVYIYSIASLTRTYLELNLCSARKSLFIHITTTSHDKINSL